MVGQSGNNSIETVKACCRALEDQKALDPVVLDISRHSGFADWFIIAGASSHGHLRGLLKTLDDFLAANRIPNRGTKRGAAEEENWILVDCGDLVVHLMAKEAREFYDLEKLWYESPRVDFHN